MAFLKKYLLLALLMIGGFSAANAQGFVGSAFAGVAGSQLTGDSLTGFHKAGVVLGISAMRQLKEKTALQVEMRFIQKGSRKRRDSLQTDIFRTNLNYIEVPLIFRWETVENLNLELGAAFAVLLGQKVSDEYGELTENDPVARPFNPYEVSTMIGLQYDFSERWALNGRFSNSITPVREHYFGQTFRLNRGQYNIVTEFTLRYTFTANNS